MEHLGVGGGKRKNCKLETNTEVGGKCEAGRKWGWGQDLQGAVGHLGAPGRRQSKGRHKRTPQGNTTTGHRTTGPIPQRDVCKGLSDTSLRLQTAF